MTGPGGIGVRSGGSGASPVSSAWSSAGAPDATPGAPIMAGRPCTPEPATSPGRGTPRSGRGPGNGVSSSPGTTPASMGS
jgi:hypothetical protein